MYRRYPPEHNVPNVDERQEDEDDIAEADHLSRITQEQLKIKEEETTLDSFVKPFYLGKSSARAMLAQVIKVKNESRSSRSASVSTTSSGKDAETDSDVDTRLPSPGQGDGLGQSPSANSDVEMQWDSQGVGPCMPYPTEFMERLRPEYWQVLPVRGSSLSLIAIADFL